MVSCALLQDVWPLSLSQRLGARCPEPEGLPIGCSDHRWPSRPLRKSAFCGCGQDTRAPAPAVRSLSLSLPLNICLGL